MKQSTLRAICHVALLLSLTIAFAYARDEGAAETSMSSITENALAGRLAGEFAVLAGSRENAESLVSGLHTATLVRLAAVTTSIRASTFTASARPMSYPDIRKALSLAQAQLLAKHLDSPTPEQIKAALVGGELPNAQGEATRVIGILPLHQRGMTWDQIARAIRVAAPKNLVAI